MKIEKKHYWIIAAVILVIAAYFFLRKKSESKYDPFTSDAFGIEDENAPVMDSLESSFGRGGMGRGGGFFHGGRGRWGGGYGGYGSYGSYPYYYPYPYYDDEPIIVRGSTKCPNGWIWMGAMLGCEKPQGL